MWETRALQLKEEFLDNARAAAVFAAAPDAEVLDEWRGVLREAHASGSDQAFLERYKRLLQLDSLQSLWEAGAKRSTGC